jgi:hypothetical protein
VIDRSQILGKADSVILSDDSKPEMSLSEFEKTISRDKFAPVDIDTSILPIRFFDNPYPVEGTNTTPPNPHQQLFLPNAYDW